MEDNRHSCRRCGGELRDEELRCPVCGMFAPVSEDGTEGSLDGGRKVRAQVIRCTACHAAVTYSAEAQNLKCAYCGEVMQVETPRDSIDVPEKFIPFAVTPADAEKGLKEFWSRARWYHHGDIAEKGGLAELRALWWPAWVCAADVVFSWTADTHRGSGRSRWAPHSGQVPTDIQAFCISASRGLKEEETDAIEGGYDLSTAKDAPEGPEGATVECFELPRSKARQRILGRIDSLGKGLVSAKDPQLNGESVRNLHATAHVENLKTVNMCFPAYVMAYRYGDRLYRVVINGANASVSTGEYPVSVLAVTVAVLLGCAAFAGIVFGLMALMS